MRQSKQIPFTLVLLTTTSLHLISCSQKVTPTATALQQSELLLTSPLLSLTKEDLFFLQSHSPNTLIRIQKQETISIDDIFKMHEAGLRAEALIEVIELTKSTFHLTTADVIRLQLEGIPFKVINYMIGT